MKPDIHGTNEQYRKARKLDKPFTATPEQARQAWRELFGEQIDAAARHAVIKERMQKLRFARQRTRSQ